MPAGAGGVKRESAPFAGVEPADRDSHAGAVHAERVDPDVGVCDLQPVHVQSGHGFGSAFAVETVVGIESHRLCVSAGPASLRLGQGIIDVNRAAVAGANVRLIMGDSATAEKTDTVPPSPLTVRLGKVTLDRINDGRGVHGEGAGGVKRESAPFAGVEPADRDS